MAYHMTLIALTVLLCAVCQAEEDFDIPVAAWEIPADATRPDNIKNPYFESEKSEESVLNKPFVLQLPRRRSNANPAANAKSSTQSQQMPPFFLKHPTAGAAVEKSELSSAETAEGMPDSRAKTSWKDDTEAYNQQIAATVNGDRILKGEILARYADYLSSMRKGLQSLRRSQAEFDQQREVFTQQDLPAHVQHRLIVAAVESSVTPQEWAKLRNQLAEHFTKDEIPKLLRHYGVDTRDELEAVLQDLGTTLGYTQKQFAVTAFCHLFVSREMARDDVISGDEMTAYYEEHLQDYVVPANVDWQQIQITFFNDDSKKVALHKMEQARLELELQVPTKEVSDKYSDGIHAKEGGLWKAMAIGTLTDQKLEKLLFEMPMGRWSEIHEGPSELQLVRVARRRVATTSPYEKVQVEIRHKLNAARLRNLLLQMVADAKIETKYELSQLYEKTE